MSVSPAARVVAISRYPVKGLSPDRLDKVALAVGETLPFDRAWAIENGRSGFDRNAPEHLPKTKFLERMRDERLALLDTRFDEATRTLTILRDGKRVVSGRLDDPFGRKLIAQFFAGFMEGHLRGAPRVLTAPGHSFSDVADKCVSIINRASVDEIARVVGRPVDPDRFRGNFLVEGLAPWEELGWTDREIRIGTARLAVFSRIVRCAATNVNPATAERDMQIPRTLMESFGHMDCGVYGRVIEAGEVEIGAPIGPA